MLFYIVLLFAQTLVPLYCQNFIPTEYSPNSAIIYDINNLNYNMRMDLCNVDVYEGCLFEAYMNIPFEQWSISNGVYSQYSVVGGDNCNTLLCSNDLNSNTPQNCSFYLPKNFTNELYLVSQAGITVSLSTTFSLKINCAVHGTTKFVPYKGGCPNNADVSKQNVKLSSPGSVTTSPDVPVVYSFLVCPTTSSFTSFDYVLEATDQNSAFATYFCAGSPCNVGHTQAGWYDASGAAINTVNVGNLKSSTLFFAIYGWGNYQATNNFVFNIQVSDDTEEKREKRQIKKLLN